MLLQTADLVIENLLNKNQVKVKSLFHQGAQMSFLTERIKHALNLKTISVNLVPSKSRLAPIKGSTIPRLELLGNLLLSRLIDSVKKSLSKVLSISEVFLWTDSQVTFAWIRTENKEFQTFVEN